MARNTVLSFFLTLFLLTHLTASQQDSSICTEESMCVKPQPLASPQEGELLAAVRELQCEVACIEEHRVELAAINLTSSWPSLMLDGLMDNCRLYQKVYECKEGCMTRSVNPDLTVNKCRDQCFKECESVICGNRQTTCVKHSTSRCERECRKTYCRFGCIIYGSLQRMNDTSQRSSPPLTAPRVMKAQSENAPSHRWLYTVDPAVVVSPHSESNGDGRHDIGFILKIVVLQNNHISYHWQKNITTPFDLSPFTCQQVSISVTIISKFTPVENQASLIFSPETTLCVPGLGGYPNQVRQQSIRVAYGEDFRENYLGYAIANISWSKPEGFQYVSSYSLTVYPDRHSCGGAHTKYTYTNIDKDHTSFSVLAETPNGFLKFGCSYGYELVTLPASQMIIGPYVTSVVSLSGPAPLIAVLCTPVWNKTSGHFNICVSWNILPNTTQPSHISGFTLTPMLQSIEDMLTRYSPLSFTPENGFNKFSVVLPDFEPKKAQNYRVEVEATKDSSYHWRTTPESGFCTISADPRSPEQPWDISVSGSSFNRTKNEVSFNLKWSTPIASYGGLERYEVHVTEELVINVDTITRPLQTFAADVTEATISALLEINDTAHCAFLQMRAVNRHQLASNWSESLVIPLDDQCTTSTADDTGHITLFYETDEGNTVKLLEVGCTSDSALFKGETQSHLVQTIKGIEQRMDSMNSHLLLNHEEHQRMVSLEQQLHRVEEKLDALMELMATHAVNAS